MSRDAAITLTWGDGDYVFRLAWGEIVMLQEATDSGPPEILKRLEQDRWRVEDISSIIRIGLIGGGLEPIQALKLTRTYVESRPPYENLHVAHAILMAGIVGAPDEDSVKKNGDPIPETASTPSPTENSESPQSMQPAP